MDIEMKIRGLMMDPVTNMPIVVLKDVNGDAILPIWVGIPEAHAIAWEIEKVTPPRPMTHDLLRNALQGLNASIVKVIVSELRDDTFYAILCLEQNGNQVCMDARPSDALALALRADCPVFVSEEVLKHSRMATSGTENMTAEELRRWLEGVNDEDMGRYKM
jgi:bifunctional DNase/RNase